jgi:hypothetical protein
MATIIDTRPQVGMPISSAKCSVVTVILSPIASIAVLTAGIVVVDPPSSSSPTAFFFVVGFRFELAKKNENDVDEKNELPSSLERLLLIDDPNLLLLLSFSY